MESLTKKSLASLPTLKGEFPYPISEKVEEGRKCLDFSIDVKIGCLLKQGFYGVAKSLIKDEYDQTMYDYIVNKKSLPKEKEFFYLANYGFYQEAKKYADVFSKKDIINVLLNPENSSLKDKQEAFRWAWYEGIVPIYEIYDVYDIFPKYASIEEIIGLFSMIDNEQLYYELGRLSNNNHFYLLIKPKLNDLLRSISHKEDKKVIKLLQEKGADLSVHIFGDFYEDTIFDHFIFFRKLDMIIFIHQLGVKFLPEDLYSALTNVLGKYDIIKYILENSDGDYSKYDEVYHRFNNEIIYPPEKYLKELVPIFLLLIKYFPNINSEDLKKLYERAISLEEKRHYSDLLDLLKEKFPSEVLCPNCHLLKNPNNI